MNIFKKTTSTLKMITRMNPILFSTVKRHITTTQNRIMPNIQKTFNKFQNFRFSDSK